MAEPLDPNDYYIYIGTIEVDGKRGYGKLKKWYDEETKKLEQKVIAFDVDSTEEK